MHVLQGNDLTEIVQPQNSRFSSVPGKTYHRSVRGIDMTDNVLLKDIIRHTKRLAIPEEVFLLQIITVNAPEVTDGAGGFGKNLKFAGRFSHNIMDAPHIWDMRYAMK
jgi:hypothetical protein